jgi:hypothetical protein
MQQAFNTWPRAWDVESCALHRAQLAYPATARGARHFMRPGWASKCWATEDERAPLECGPHREWCAWICCPATGPHASQPLVSKQAWVPSSVSCSWDPGSTRAAAHLTAGPPRTALRRCCQPRAVSAWQRTACRCLPCAPNGRVTALQQKEG